MKAVYLACIVVLTVFFLSACGEGPVTSSSPKSSSEPVTEQTVSTPRAPAADQQGEAKTVIPYEIHSVKEDVNVSYGTKHGGRTYVVDLIVKEPASTDQLKKVCESAVSEIQKARKERVDAVIIWLYDYPEYIGYGYTLGQAVLTSDGSWQWNLKDKDWSQRLTPEEVKIWAAWQELYHQKTAASPGALVDEDAVSKEIAARFKTTTTKVETILEKQLAWTM